MVLSESCWCGAVRYSADAEPGFSGHCHCFDCRKESGCGHVTGVSVPDAALHVSGAVSTYRNVSGNSQTVERTFCPACGTTVFSRPQGIHGITLLRAGTSDDPSALKPGLSVFVSRAVPWDLPNAMLPTFAEMPMPHPP